MDPLASASAHGPAFGKFGPRGREGGKEEPAWACDVERLSGVATPVVPVGRDTLIDQGSAGK